ncbi:MAG: four helix bundle protein [Cytophagales bacterium]|jgi:four helix bundle protein|nr:four helix bundle protein [Bacteroidota bacterium]MAC06320.1 four helix bundle protein [Balneola sp.]MAO77270.1 four helix bundle protein [Balneola sp.]MBF63016.1 four helix bundle protein [Balneola sp.]HAH52072.1 four helix bundle protein [Balneola sp.]|tara:strand:- start:3590 stop:3940 length:351 start_codon:yes stop_codon:yes gene_type:complete
MKDNLIQSKSFEFSLSIISLYKLLQNEREYIVSKQLLRSATSIGANIEEAIGGQSKRDFLAKVSISLKEARETRYWLRLLQESELTQIDVSNYQKEILSIINILSSIVKTTKTRIK